MARSTAVFALVVALAVGAMAQKVQKPAPGPLPLAPPRERCNEFSSTVQLRTRVNVTELAELGYEVDAEAPEGTFDGPRLEYLGDRATISAGEFCADDRDNQIFAGVGRSDYKEFAIGSDDGSRTAAGDFFFRVFDKQEQPTDCVVKLTVNGGEATLAPETQCPTNLQIAKAASADLTNTNATANPTPINSFSIFFTDDPSGDAPVPTPAPSAAPTTAPVAAPTPEAAPVAAPVVAAVPKPAVGPATALPPKPDVVPPVVTVSPSAVAPTPAPSSASVAKLAAAAAAVVAAALL